MEKKPRLGDNSSEPIALPNQEFKVQANAAFDVTKWESADQLKLQEAQLWNYVELVQSLEEEDVNILEVFTMSYVVRKRQGKF